jgi:hypothetical protein
VSKHKHFISRLRTVKPGQDKAILDLLHLQELGLAPGRVPVRLLENLWRLSQSQVSRRMSAINNLEVFYVKSDHGFYVLVELSEHRKRKRNEEAHWIAQRKRWEAAKQALQVVS